eukprot:scaffold129614_cov41-Prasinocladus_malaysianus.AAC.1
MPSHIPVACPEVCFVPQPWLSHVHYPAAEMAVMTWVWPYVGEGLRVEYVGLAGAPQQLHEASLGVRCQTLPEIMPGKPSVPQDLPDHIWTTSCAGRCLVPESLLASETFLKEGQYHSSRCGILLRIFPIL